LFYFFGITERLSAYPLHYQGKSAFDTIPPLYIVR